MSFFKESRAFAASFLLLLSQYSLFVPPPVGTHKDE